MTTIELRNALGAKLESHELRSNDTLAGNIIRIWPDAHAGFVPIVQAGDGVILTADEVVARRPMDGET
jgi:hypothetical protein